MSGTETPAEGWATMITNINKRDRLQVIEPAGCIATGTPLA